MKRSTLVMGPIPARLDRRGLDANSPGLLKLLGYRGVNMIQVLVSG